MACEVAFNSAAGTRWDVFSMLNRDYGPHGKKTSV